MCRKQFSKGCGSNIIIIYFLAFSKTILLYTPCTNLRLITASTKYTIGSKLFMLCERDNWFHYTILHWIQIERNLKIVCKLCKSFKWGERILYDQFILYANNCLQGVELLCFSN